MVISFIHLGEGELDWGEAGTWKRKEKKGWASDLFVNLKERNACELGWVFLIPDEEMLSGGLEMSLQSLLPCFAWLWSDEQTSGVLSGGVRRGGIWNISERRPASEPGNRLWFYFQFHLFQKQNVSLSCILLPFSLANNSVPPPSVESWIVKKHLKRHMDF